MGQPDILIFLSDQHAPQFMAGREIDVDTPNLAQLRAEGTSFDEAYTPCPLCVPSRMAMLSGRRPARTGIFTNSAALPDTLPTFLHYLVAAGYETVLIGRMHFVGQDQRHGFTRRIAPDMTPVTWSRPVEKLREERGVFSRTFAGTWAPQVVGGGKSPVIYYDEMVIQAALEYLSLKHEKPQFILVGTYGPHFPYVAPPDLFQKYWEKNRLPSMRGEIPDYMNPCLRGHRIETSDEVARGAMAAYCGLIERMDQQIGLLRSAFEAYSTPRKRPGLFGYLSDHGDQVGERDLFGKETFFEKSVRIPMMFTGDGVKSGQAVGSPVSLLDLGPTLCQYAGAELPRHTDGISLCPVLSGERADEDRLVFSEFMEKNPEGLWRYSLMLRQRDWKYVTYHGYEDQDMLFHVTVDRLERKNHLNDKCMLANRFREAARQLSPDMNEIEARQVEQAHQARLFSTYEEAIGLKESERWQDNPPAARVNPEICIAGL